MLSLDSRIERLERAAGAAATELLRVEVIFVSLSGYDVPQACADGLIAREHAERPWRPGETARYLRATWADGTCAFCGQAHRAPAETID